MQAGQPQSSPELQLAPVVVTGSVRARVRVERTMRRRMEEDEDRAEACLGCFSMRLLPLVMAQRATVRHFGSWRRFVAERTTGLPPRFHRHRRLVTGERRRVDGAADSAPPSAGKTRSANERPARWLLRPQQVTIRPRPLAAPSPPSSSRCCCCCPPLRRRRQKPSHPHESAPSPARLASPRLFTVVRTRLSEVQ